MSNIKIKNNYLSINQDITKYKNTPVINIKYLVSFSYYKKNLKDEDMPNIQFNCVGPTKVLWVFNDINKAKEICDEITNLLQFEK